MIRLPRGVEVRSVTGGSVVNFKTALDKYLEGVPDEPPVYGANHRNTLIELQAGGPTGSRGD